MSRRPRIVDAVPLGGHRLRLTFSDDLVRELDLEPILHGGIFEELRDPHAFCQVHLDEIAGTIAWPNGVDLDPDVLHGDHEPASGASASLIRQYRLEQAG